MGGRPGPVEVWTDGSCGKSQHEGGWAAVLLFEGELKEISGSAACTTSARMELTACIRGLRALREPCVVHLHCDSSYVIGAFKKGWLERWRKNGWKNSSRGPVVNRDLWEQLWVESRRHLVKWVKVRAHHREGKYPLNDRCDRLAKEARKRLEATDRTCYSEAGLEVPEPGGRDHVA